MSLQSFSQTPDIILTLFSLQISFRWLFDIQASELTLLAPNTIFSILEFNIAPKHIMQGSNVTYIAEFKILQDFNLLQAAFIAIISA